MEHRMTDTMAPGASSDCTKAYPIDSDAHTTSPSHRDTRSVHVESPRAMSPTACPTRNSNTQQADWVGLKTKCAAC